MYDIRIKHYCQNSSVDDMVDSELLLMTETILLSPTVVLYSVVPMLSINSTDWFKPNVNMLSDVSLVIIWVERLSNRKSLLLHWSVFQGLSHVVQGRGDWKELTMKSMIQHRSTVVPIIHNPYALATVTPIPVKQQTTLTLIHRLRF